MKVSQGTSLLEALLCVILLGAFSLPLTLLLQARGSNSKETATHTSKMIVINDILSQVDPENPDFYNAYNKSTMQTLTINGITVPYITKVDTNYSNALKKRLYIYVYKNQNSALTAPAFRYTQDYELDSLRIDCGEPSAGRVDASGNVWSPDVQYNPGSNYTYAGWSAAGAGVGSEVADITNSPDANDPVYTTYRRTGTSIGNAFQYRFDVDNGNYIVQLYFAELSGSTRTMDVSLEGSVPAAPDMNDFNPYTAAGNSNNRAVMRSIPVTVSDGTLNVVVTNQTSGQEARLMGIAIRRVPG